MIAVRLRPLGPRRLELALEHLGALEPNYNSAARPGPDEGWHVDDETTALPPEQPGPPVPGGSWEVACQLVESYAFSDPSVVRAIFDPSRPLSGRNLLLELHVAGLVLYAGCRVRGVVDETRGEADGAVRVWGWYYQTLAGHVESGERAYEVRKRIGTGTVEFRTRAFSRPAPGNPVVALGFHLLGRRRQRVFTRIACERMATLTRAALTGEADVSPAAGHGKLALVAETRLLAIYLDDHVAVVVGTRELVKRMLGQTRDEAIRSFLEELQPELEHSERELTRALEELGRRPSIAKRTAAWLAEKAGRIKPNGNISGYSPLTRVVELEYLATALELERSCWRTLHAAAPQLARPDGAFAAEAKRVEQRLQLADDLRQEAAEAALVAQDERRL